MKNLKIILFIVIGLISSYNLKSQPLSNYSSEPLNPYADLSGSIICNEIPSKNPATIGLINNVSILQSFPLTAINSKLRYSQLITIPLSRIQKVLLTYSLTDNYISLLTSHFSFTYSLNILKTLTLGIKINFSKICHPSFTPGILYTLKLGDFIRYINIGIYGINSKISKLNLNLPNTTYGEKVIWGVGAELSINSYNNIILSYENDLINKNQVISLKNKTHSIGISWEHNITKSYKFKIMTLNKIKDNKQIISRNGISIGNENIEIVLEDEYNFINNKDYKILGFIIKSPLTKKREKRVNISYQIERNNICKITFQGEKENIIFYTLKIYKDNKLIKSFKGKDDLPDYLNWDINKIEDGIYRLELLYTKGGINYNVFKIQKYITILH